MQPGAITQYIDVAQLVLYAFWFFFAGLIYYLVRENKREGYPLVDATNGRSVAGFPPAPPTKTYRLADGSSVSVPRPGPGLGVGPGGYAERRDIPDVTVDGVPKMVPLRIDPSFRISGHDIDPRGLPVVGADGVTGGVVRDVWVDRSEVVFRYLECEVGGSGTAGAATATVLVPTNFSRVNRRSVNVDSILGRDFVGVPRTRQPDSITFLEEERITAYFGAGTLFATPSRAEPLL